MDTGCGRAGYLSPQAASAQTAATSRSKPARTASRAGWAASRRREPLRRSMTRRNGRSPRADLSTRGPVVFEDATKAAGLSGWQHVMGTQTKKVHPGDGWLGRWPDRLRQRRLARYLPGERIHLRCARPARRTPPHAALFHNNHDGTFTDVAAKAGVTNDRWGFGVAIGDL